jgi:ribosomal protein S27AE
VRPTTDGGPASHVDPEHVDAIRLICEDCGVKWFVPGNGDVVDERLACGACGGPLVALEARDGGGAPGWTGETG